MHRILKFRRGNTAVTSTFVGASGEVTIDTSRNLLVVHDGVTPGGHPQDSTTVTATFSSTPPTSPIPGQLWIDTDNGIEYVYFDDGLTAGQWVEFGNTGGLSFPNKLTNNTVQLILNSAGIVIFPAAPVPVHSYGAAGDVLGMVAFDSNYLYYCTANYVNNSTDIWKRVALNSAAW